MKRKQTTASLASTTSFHASQLGKKRQRPESSTASKPSDAPIEDESTLLAALGSSVQNMAQYEQGVLKSAEMENTPKLLAWNSNRDNANTEMDSDGTLSFGFPPLSGLAPSGHPSSDMTHFQTALALVRTQMEKSPHNITLALKQQMLLQLIHTTSQDKELCVRMQEEIRQERVRQQRFRRQLQQSKEQPKQQSTKSRLASAFEPDQGITLISDRQPPNAKRRGTTNGGRINSIDNDDQERAERLEQIKQGAATTKTVRFADVPPRITPRRRIGIQKRRSQMASGDSAVEEETEQEWEQRKSDLKQIRKDREERRRRRREEWGITIAPADPPTATKASNSDEEETEFQDETMDAKNGSGGENSSQKSSASSQSTIEKNPAVNPQPPARNVTSPPTMPQVRCPLCQEFVMAPTADMVDEELSRHMGNCQSERRTTRGQVRASRRPKKAVNYNEVDENEIEELPVPATEFPNKGASEETKKDIPVVDIDDFIADEEEDDEPLQVDDNDQVNKTQKTTSSTPNRKTPSRPRGNRGARPSSIRHPPLDDFDEDDYEDRVDNWIGFGIDSMRVMKERDANEAPPGEEAYDGGLVVPAWVNDRLFPYQRTGLKWMWELHRQQAGGIIGDEMGLGKTVQLCAFLGAMAASRKLKSILVIAPATMLQHWLTELKTWAPGLRRLLIHSSADGDDGSIYSKRNVTNPLLRNLDKWLKDSRRHRLFEAIDEDDHQLRDSSSFCGTGYVLLTTYENVRRNSDVWTNHHWSYIVMDEAQKIRNPDADVTLVCKRLRTPHRLALSGTPIQNDLRELWSLFDFVFPGRLGTLPAFESEFADPIKRGGYSNASPMQVQLAYRCALVLRDLINPYLLRRLKTDVKEVNRMPGKKEQVLFCRLSDRQRIMYESFLQSDQVKHVLRGSTQMLGAITTLRKICNHPDLICPPDSTSLGTFLQKGYFAEGDLDQQTSDEETEEDIAEEESLTERSGKLEVLAKILPLWYQQGHRVLIFCQWRKMLNIIQRFTEMQGWKFGRLDGNTNIAARQRLVDSFNSDDSYYGMLMTTRTGGVGLNLTGADRIILYDPDWNPQTDAQARERAWRFGQEREVTIYRLIAAGTVEEKIYQRQIFKTALSNRVLQDPRQRRLFSQKDLKDLFTLQADSGSVISGGDGMTETGELTKGDGYVDPDEHRAQEASQDDGETMRSVLQSNGLAGVFDHSVVENRDSSKKGSVRDMEEKARQVAKEAAAALKESVEGHNRFAPTWTGSEETQESRFGENINRVNRAAFREPSLAAGVKMNGTQATAPSSHNLLSSIQKRKKEIASDGGSELAGKNTKRYSSLLKRIRDFVRTQAPTTEELLDEFSSVNSSDAAVFRQLLKSTATIDGGRWRLRG